MNPELLKCITPRDLVSPHMNQSEIQGRVTGVEIYGWKG